MRRFWSAMMAVCAFSSLAFAQSFDAAVGGGRALFPGSSSMLGTATADPASGAYSMKDGFRIVFRMALNSWRFMGHEFGYAYNHTSIDAPATTVTSGIGRPGQPATQTIPASSIGVPAHQGFYDFLVYAVPEGKHIRPFVCGGVQFTAFSQPGAYYGNRETKYGVNYGGGLKVQVSGPWGFRLDARQYNMSKPFSLPNASGRMLMWEYSGGFAFFL